jgi:hypothetical protein
MQVTPDIDYKRLYEGSQLKILALEQQLNQLQKMIFGAKQERFVPVEQNPSQLLLDIQVEATASSSVVHAKRISYTRTQTTVEQAPLVHPGRMKLPENLRREEIIIEPQEDISQLKKIGAEITEVLEYEPGELFVKNMFALNMQSQGVKVYSLAIYQTVP